MSQSIDIPLHDIMPLVEVPEPSMYGLSAFVVMGLIFFVGGVLWFLKWNRHKKINERRVRYEALQRIDLKNPKESAYAMSKEGYFFAHNNERTFNAYQHLFTRLEPYKYAPTVEKIDEETLGYYYRYLETIQV